MVPITEQKCLHLVLVDLVVYIKVDLLPSPIGQQLVHLWDKVAFCDLAEAPAHNAPMEQDMTANEFVGRRGLPAEGELLGCRWLCDKAKAWGRLLWCSDQVVIIIIAVVLLVLEFIFMYY